MAQVDVALTFAQLLNLSAEFSLPVDVTNRKLRKWDLVKFLRDYTLDTVVDNKNMKELLKSVKPIFDTMSAPQLCYQYELLDPISKREVFNSADWIFEKKLNGYRSLMTFTNDTPALWSRTIDCATFFPVLFENLYLEGFHKLRKLGLPTFVLDGEILPKRVEAPFRNEVDYLYHIFNTERGNTLELQRSNPVVFYPFDIVYYDGQWVADLPLFERAKLLESLLVKLEEVSPHFGRVPRVLANKGKFLDRVFRSGAEGVVAKNLNSPYNLTGLRRKDHFVKVKRSYFLNGEVMQFQDTMDGWISNAITDSSGAITDIEVSVYIRDGEQISPQVLARVPVPFSQRTPFLRFNQDGAYFDPLLGTVVEIDGTGFSESGTLVSPILIRFRLDKSVHDCVIEKQDLLIRFHKEATI